MSKKRIALVGAGSTGKTTVYEALKGYLLDYKFVNESTRSVKKLGFPINEAGTNETQLAISSFHLEALLNPSDLVLDRCYLDLVVYSTLTDRCKGPTYQYIIDTWSRIRSEYTAFIYFPIEFKSIGDGVRSTNEEWRNDADILFTEFLYRVEQPVIEVRGTAQERINQVLTYLNRKTMTRDNMMSIYDFLGRAGGGEVGKAVYEAAMRAKVEVSTKEVANKAYSGKIMVYPKSFLTSYFGYDSVN